MSNVIVECVPNFSEGRIEATLVAIESALTSVAQVFLLGRESDPDHNRSVYTIAGPPDAVCEAAVRAVGIASTHIDLTRQTGEHPRLGAADVVPFVPVSNITVEECAELAWKAGEQIWQRHGVPVYFYEAAAKIPARVKLEDVRRGQFEGLLAELKLNSDRAPDLGTGQLHPTAGATIVGARKFLIAYNINLQTNRLDIAKAIAKKIRTSSGGLAHVKAMGVMLHSRQLAQVSMNLTDFETTSIYTVYDAVSREAAACGVTVAGSELIGLIPRRAVEMGFAEAMKLERFRHGSVLENALDAKLNV